MLRVTSITIASRGLLTGPLLGTHFPRGCDVMAKSRWHPSLQLNDITLGEGDSSSDDSSSSGSGGGSSGDDEGGDAREDRSGQDAPSHFWFRLLPREAAGDDQNGGESDVEEEADTCVSFPDVCRSPSPPPGSMRDLAVPSLVELSLAVEEELRGLLLAPGQARDPRLVLRRCCARC